MQFDQLKRRQFITLLVGAAPGWPLGAHAQAREPIRRVGVLTTIFGATGADTNAWLGALEDEVRKLRWDEGRNIYFDMRLLGDNPQQLPAAAAEIIATKPDVILVAGSPSLIAAARQTKTIPIVFVQVIDPVQLKLVSNLARPGGNITGFTNFEHQIGGKWIELLKDVAPKTNRAAVLFDPENAAQPVYVQGVETAAAVMHVHTSRAAVRNRAEIEQAITTFAQQPNSAIIVVPNSVTIYHRKLIIDLAAQTYIPAMYAYRLFAESGGLISYGADLPDIWRKAGSYVDRILRGANPGDLPIQLATKFELVVNLKAAKALGLTIPEPFLQQANEVIE